MSYLNDPRVLFAAERTLLAWNRTAISLITIGFGIERLGIIKFDSSQQLSEVMQRMFSFYIGLSLMLLAIVISLVSMLQFHRFVYRLSAEEKPQGYIFWHSYLVHISTVFIAIALAAYLIFNYGWFVV